MKQCRKSNAEELLYTHRVLTLSPELLLYTLNPVPLRKNLNSTPFRGMESSIASLLEYLKAENDESCIAKKNLSVLVSDCVY